MDQPSIAQGLVAKGYELLERGNPRRFQTFGTWEKEGVCVALCSNNFLAVERGQVIIYCGEDEDMTLEAIITDIDVRGQGRARQALLDVTSLADLTGQTLYLEPVQLETGSGLTRGQLIDFYAASDFKALCASDKVMVRTPCPLP